MTNESAVAIQCGVTDVIHLHGFGVSVDIRCPDWVVVVTDDFAADSEVQDCKLWFVEFPTILSEI